MTHEFLSLTCQRNLLMFHYWTLPRRFVPVLDTLVAALKPFACRYRRRRGFRLLAVGEKFRGDTILEKSAQLLAGCANPDFASIQRSFV